MKNLILALSISLISFYNFAQIDEGFEGAFPPDGWELVNGGSAYNWELNTIYGGFGNSSNSASFNNHPLSLPTNTWYVLRMPNLDLTGSSTPMLEFDIAYARYSASQNEGISIWRSFNGVSGWSRIMNYTGADIATAADTTSPFTPTNAEWKTIQLDLSTFNNSPLIRFAFEVNTIGSIGGNIVYIDNVKITDVVLSTEIVNENSFIKIYPNPSLDRIMVYLNEDNLSQKNFKIYNSLGQDISTFKLKNKDSNYEIEFGNLAKGIYILKVQLDRNTYSKPFIVN